MPACTRRDFLLRAAAGLAAFATTSVVRAEGIVLAQADITLKGEQFQLSGYFDIQLSSTLENALLRGVQLTFVQAFEAQRERDYWLAEDLIELQRSTRLSYNALLRQYHVSLQGVSSSHETLADALRAVDQHGMAALRAQSLLEPGREPGQGQHAVAAYHPRRSSSSSICAHTEMASLLSGLEFILAP